MTNGLEPTLQIMEYDQRLLEGWNGTNRIYRVGIGPTTELLVIGITPTIFLGHCNNANVFVWS